MRKDTDEERIIRIMNTCIHFNGIQNDICEAGLNYDEVQGNQKGVRLPCFYRAEDLTNPIPKAHCDKIQYRTRDEAIGKLGVQREHGAQMFVDISNGLCPYCHQPVKHMQSGPCVYGHPCGHRLYQGKAIDQFLYKGEING